MPHLTTLWKAIVLSFIINYLIVHAATPAPSAGHTDDNVAQETGVWGAEEEEEFMPSFLHVKKLFNEGKPFFVEKDPVSGQLDFNHKKSAGVVENYRSPAEELIPLRTNEITPNIHDFLHLPVKYSSSKSVYPLVSSSYANTKYQGSNKEEGSNHKEYSTMEIQKRPNFFTSNAIFPFEKTTTFAPSSSTTRPPTEKPSTLRTTPTVTTFKPSFPRRPSRPIPTRFQVQDPSPHWQRTEFPPPSTTATPPTTRFIPTIPTTTTTRTTYSPTVPTSTEPATRKHESPATTEKVPSPPQQSSLITSSTTAVPITTTNAAPPKKPLVFPTEPALSLMEMLNSFADESNPNVNAIQINENAQPFQRPSGFRPPPQRDVVAAAAAPQQPPQTTTRRPASPPPSSPINSNPNPMVNFNDYVKYDIQAPNMVSFHSHNEPVSSMNNIKISPDQNVASFVLGSKQSFGGLGGGAEGSHSQVQLQTGPQPGKVIGQVFNEPISGGAVSIRFPSKEEDKRFDSAVITGSYKNVHDMPNGHSAPFGFDPTKQRVSFPTPSASGSILANGQDSKMVGTKIVFESNDQINSNSNIFPTREVLALKGNPSQQRPIATENEHGMGQQELPPQRNRPFPPPKYFNEYPPQQSAPNNQHLPNRPNILPQFRPTTKSHGQHPHPYKESNAYRHPYIPNSNRRVYGGPPPPSASGSFRRPPYPDYGHMSGPPQRPNNNNYQNSRFQSKMAPAPPPPPTKEQIEANRRMYKLPQTQPLFAGPTRINPYFPGAPQPQASDRVFNVRPQGQYPVDTTGVTPLTYDNSNRYTQMDPLTLKNNYIEDDSFKSPPNQERRPNAETKLEPVETLQMIQAKKVAQGTKLSTLHADIPKNGIPTGDAGNSTDKPVYVVYPIREKPVEPENTVIVGHRGEHGPAAPPSPPELNVASGAYQNTPFTVIHHEQQPILTTLQKHLSIPKSPNRTNFPYQLEQPDPNSASELDSKTRRKDNHYPVQDSIYNIGEQPAAPQIRPKILNKPNVEAISAKLPMVTERPVMAIAYTPSTRPPQTAQQQQGGYYNHYSMPNYDSAVIPEILDNYQSTPFKKDELDAAYPVGGGDYYEKDFQAPFHPSINLGTISDSYHGWSILDRTTTIRTNEIESKKNSNAGNEIDRKDKNKNELIIGDFTSETKDPAMANDGFQPELEGGFRPIVPPHLMNVDHHQMAMQLDEDIPIAEKQVAAQQRPHEMVVGKDTMVDISAEMQMAPQKEESKPMAVEIKPSMEKDDEDEEEMEREQEQEEEEVEQQKTEEVEYEEEPQKMKEPERRPLMASSTEPSVSGSTTEKVMSFEDALSAIFGLSDDGFVEEMTTKSQSNEISKERSATSV